MKAPRLTSPSEQVSLETPIFRARRLGRVQLALTVPVAMAAALLGYVTLMIPIEDRLVAYAVLTVVLAAGGASIGLVDYWIGRCLAAVLSSGSTLRRAASERAAELARSNSDLRRRDRQRAELFATLAQELRAPLNAILGYSQTLTEGLDGDLTDEQRADATRIYEGGKEILAIVNSAAELARIESGAITIAREPVSASMLVDEVVSLLRPLAASEGLKLVADTPAELLRVFADEERLRQVLIGLVGNAIKFTDEGTITVRAEAGEAFVTISVTDTGPGIAPADQERIFEPFQQAASGTGREKRGTGLGLTIARRLVEKMGGQITLDSQPGAGATFAVTVPIASGEEADSLRLRFDNRRNGVLVVGDGVGVERLAAALERRALKTETADRAGWQRVAADIDPAIVVLDLARPRAAAWQVLAELRSDPAHRERPVALVALNDEEGSLVNPGGLDFLLEEALDAQLVERVDALRAASPSHRLGVQTGVLVASEDGVWRYRVNRLLQAAGYETIEATNGEEALDLAHKYAIQLAVVDLMLPEQGIVPILAELRDGELEMPVLVIGPMTLSPVQQRRLYLGTMSWLKEQGRPVGQVAARLKAAVMGPARPAPRRDEEDEGAEAGPELDLETMLADGRDNRFAYARHESRNRSWADDADDEAEQDDDRSAGGRRTWKLSRRSP